MMKFDYRTFCQKITAKIRIFFQQLWKNYWKRLTALFVVLFLLLSLIVLRGIFLLKLPPKQTMQERLALIPHDNLPITENIQLYWDKYQIPHIKSDNDADAAFALGMVHAHLRLGQIEAYRMLSQGRLSEMLPLKIFADVDAGLRALGFGRSVEAAYQNMPSETRLWLERFTEGLNYYKAHLPVRHLPHEIKLMGIDASIPFTPQDILTIGKLSGASPSWFRYFSQLPLLKQEQWQNRLAMIRELGTQGVVSYVPNGIEYQPHPALQNLEDLLLENSRSGSNSLVVSPQKSRSHAALIANDPHLGMSIPNFWLIISLDSPSYRGVGMMVAGVPAFGFGRTPDIAWGGTNLHGQDSDMVDVSDLPSDAFTSETHLIKRRFFPDKEVTVRISPYGPVLSDLDFMPQIERDYAMSWVGHHSDADELTALLRASQAKDFTMFRDAMQGFATPGQNFLFADKKGNIGQIVAAHIPKRDAAYKKKILLTPQDYDAYWKNIQNAGSLPFALNPKKQYLASANNRPYAGEPEIGYNFSSGERVQRMSALLEGDNSWDIEKLKKLQMDTFWGLSLSLTQQIIPLMQDYIAGLEADNQQADILLQLLIGWDGYYAKDSTGAAAFELFIGVFSDRLFQLEGKGDIAVLFRRAGIRRLLLAETLEGANQDNIHQAIASGIAAWQQQKKDMPLTWSELHYLDIQHIFGNIPLIGKRYKRQRVPLAGSNETIFKTAHDNKTAPSSTSYGTQSRHISDMADIDENYFVLLGGQDGHLGSENFSDQAKLWVDNQLIRLPLSADGVREHFSYKMLLSR